MFKNLISDLNKLSNPAKAKVLTRFFKTGKGEYGEGDIFLGIMVPDQRKIAQKYSMLATAALKRLLTSRIHEYRLVALLILVDKYEKSSKRNKKDICGFYLRQAKEGNINNWDLVDLSAPKILGDYLFASDKNTLYNLARSTNLWARRIAIVSTFNFIKRGRFTETIEISKILISDKEDLIHKAVGWMLREVGKKNLDQEIKFLNKYASKMPRTMLRYAIERFKNKDRQNYLKK